MELTREGLVFFSTNTSAAATAGKKNNSLATHVMKPQETIYV